MSLQPIVKWAGGKRQLLSSLITYLPSSYKNYYEPFIGGGALLFHLTPTKAVVNDINPQLINIYQQLQRDPSSLEKEIQELDNHFIDNSYYLDIRTQYNDCLQKGELSVHSAALMIWLNKHCFNGLYRVNKQGLFNVGFNKNTNKTLVGYDYLSTSKFLQIVTIYNKDFEDVCSTVEKDDFVYFDSPYLPKSKTANFTAYSKDGFTEEDHIRLSNLYKKLDKKGAKLMLSNNNVPKVKELYEGYRIIPLITKCSINSDGSNRTSKEVLVINY